MYKKTSTANKIIRIIWVGIGIALLVLIYAVGKHNVEIQPTITLWVRAYTYSTLVLVLFSAFIDRRKKKRDDFHKE